jgi:hypothetical protein
MTENCEKGEVFPVRAIKAYKARRDRLHFFVALD